VSLEISPNVFFRCVEDSSEAIMITDRFGKLCYVNPTWCRVYGYTPIEALGATPSLLRSGQQDSHFYDVMWSHIRNPEVGHWKGELVNRTKTGELVNVLLTITPYRNAEGEISGYMGLALDISEKKRVERRLQEEDRLSSIGLLASGLAHEIGTPMTVIRGRAELLSMHAPPQSALQSGLKVIVDQIDRISGLIQSLLNLARNPSQSSQSEILILPIIRSVIDLLAVPLRKSACTIEIECPETTKVCGDPNRLTQVFLNLCVNAIHALEDCRESKISQNANWQPELRIVVTPLDEKNLQVSRFKN
jgi:PAS domain S-box-containing protein